MSTIVKRKRGQTRSEILREIADRCGVSKDRLRICVEAFQILSQDELKVIGALLDLAEVEAERDVYRELLQMALKEWNELLTQQNQLSERLGFILAKLRRLEPQ
jgi:hypothetical protein